jgi:hypothetical protein
MKRLISSVALAAALFIGQQAHAQLSWVAGYISNGNFENGIFGIVASGPAPFNSVYTPAWSTVALPTTLYSGESITWGIADGSAGSTWQGGQTDGTYALKNIAFRNVIRGASNNGGVASVFNMRTILAPSTSQVQVQILGPSLANYGVVGAQSFTWRIYNGSVLLSSGYGEANFPLAGVSGLDLRCEITPGTSTTLGSVFASFTAP